MSAPTLIFLHCFGGSAKSWNAVLARLGGAFETLAIDLPGFGGQAGVSGPYTVTGYADYVEAALRVRGCRDFILIGHSMGGKVALALAARHPAGLRAQVLLAPSPPTPEPIEDEARAALIAGWAEYTTASETLARITARALAPDARKLAIDDIMRSGKAAWTAWLEHGSREDISAEVGAIAVPTTILSGSSDEVLPTELMRREVADRLRRVALVSVPGAGHFLPVEAPDAVAAAVVRAVGGVDEVGKGQPAAWRVGHHQPRRCATQ